MLATLHRAPILAAVGLLAAAFARMPERAPALASPAGCPVPATPIVVPAPVVAPARLIYISGPDVTNDSQMIFTPPDRAPELR
ncbi:MAG TPA: hypothetical protein VH143_25825 [Kofleriaceae bacterium]|jgi:hypothetical protein|nr:hypothetical protein [Kofleriaceae bacterium]